MKGGIPLSIEELLPLCTGLQRLKIGFVIGAEWHCYAFA